MKLSIIFERISYETIRRELDNIAKSYRTNLYDSYRKVKPEIDSTDFFISTIGTFRNTGLSIQEFDKIKADKYNRSDSGSEYKIVGKYLYRLSDHWGRVASCRWDIDYAGTDKVVGKIKIDDLKPNLDFSSGYIKYYPDAEEKLDAALLKINSLKSNIDMNVKMNLLFDKYESEIRKHINQIRGQ